ncbi:hypothetical protein TNCV_2586591 [Trichonephila clavipes]|nr:hypothetical protein TNCV_2586591 [Trichonephila clavipes]
MNRVTTEGWLREPLRLVTNGVCPPHEISREFTCHKDRCITLQQIKIGIVSYVVKGQYSAHKAIIDELSFEVSLVRTIIFQISKKSTTLVAVETLYKQSFC